MTCAINGFFLVFICTSLRSAPQVINQVIQFLFAYLGQMCCVDCFVFFVIAMPPCSDTHEISGIQIMVVQHCFIYITIGGHNRTHQFIATIMYVRRQLWCVLQFFQYLLVHLRVSSICAAWNRL